MELIENYHLKEVLILLFLAVTFTISIVEKFVDWDGTIDYMTEFFDKTIATSVVKPALALLMLLESLTTAYLLTGIYNIIATGEKDNAILGCFFSCLSIIYLLIGQRIAKNYPGATSVTVYFILSIIALYKLS